MSLSRAYRKLSQRVAMRAVQLMFGVGALVPPLAVHAANRLFYRPGRKKPGRTPALPGVEELTLDVNGRRVAAYIAGSGQPVLLVHGWQTSASHLDALAQSMLERGFRIVSFDMPAHGKSDGDEADITDVIAIGLEFSRRYGPFAAAIGHSYGGLCLASLLRLGVVAERVILIASPAKYSLLIERLCKLLGLSTGVRTRFVADINQRYRPHSFESDFDGVQNLTIRPVPTLIVHDESDTQVPVSDAALLIESHPQVQSMITSGFGHSYIVKAPPVVTACLSFLSDGAQKATPTASTPHTDGQLHRNEQLYRDGQPS